MLSYVKAPEHSSVDRQYHAYIAAHALHFQVASWSMEHWMMNVALLSVRRLHCAQ